ncbi:MAG: transposase zinc-binding domain-containing protein [Luteimonas sp.]
MPTATPAPADSAAVAGCTASALAPGVYRRRRPERMLAYQVVQGWLETWLAQTEEAEPNSVAGYVERELRGYLECGILAHGFARARCPECAADFLVAFSCKGRGVCPSCTTKRMAATAAHLVDAVIPQVPMRQWVLSLPKRLRPMPYRHAAHRAALSFRR